MSHLLISVFLKNLYAFLYFTGLKLTIFREIKDVVKHEVLLRKEQPEKIEFELKDNESNFAE
jgi:hypothetical protein